jgi:hypothetical protein
MASVHPGLELVLLSTKKADKSVTKVKTPLLHFYFIYFVVCVDRHIPSLVLPIAEIPYTVNGKKVELAVKKILAGQQVAHFLTFFILSIDRNVYG